MKSMTGSLSDEYRKHSSLSYYAKSKQYKSSVFLRAFRRIVCLYKFQLQMLQVSYFMTSFIGIEIQFDMHIVHLCDYGRKRWR